MVQVKFKGNTIEVGGNFPKPGSMAPSFTLTDGDLTDRTLADFGSQKKLISIVPSLDTPVCLTSTHKFSQAVKGKSDVVFVLISCDLPFAQQRACTGEKLENVKTLSAMRHKEFLNDYGVDILSGPMQGLTARAVLVLNGSNQVLHSELVCEITQEPDYGAAINCL